MAQFRHTGTFITQLKPGFHSSARNARKVLRKKKYASKIKMRKKRNKRKKITQAKTKVRKRKSGN